MALITAPLELGDIFDKTVKLVGKTVGRTAVVAVIILLPLTIVMSFILSSIMHELSAMMLASAGAAQAGRAFSESEAIGIATPLARILPLGLGIGFLYVIGMAAAESAILRINCDEVDGGAVSWRQALNNAFGGTMWRLIGQRMLLMVALIAAYLLLVITGVMFPFLLIISIPALIVGVVWAWTRWFFAPQVIVNEGSGVINSFGRSGDLVQGQFWRVLGIGVLLAFISGIAVSIVSTPFQLFAMSGFWSGYMDMITHAGDRSNPEEQLRTMAAMFSGMGPGFGILIGIQAILSLMVQPSYQVVMYYDACARRGDLEELEHDNEDDFLLG